MRLTAGIDVGAGAVKAVVMRLPHDDDENDAALLSSVVARIRKRDVSAVVKEVFDAAVREAGSARSADGSVGADADAGADEGVDAIHYVASTGDGEDIPFATGHFYGMTSHARGALFLEPGARAVLDIGALHARCITMDEHGKVLGYKMTSQCASGSGQFLENISRYLGVSQADVGALSLGADDPERVSSICAVLAETDVINMVSRGISTPNILRGVHESMAGRFARLLLSQMTQGMVFVSGGLAGDVGLVGAIADAITEQGKRRAANVEIRTNSLSIYAGAIGAAIWGGFRFRKTQGQGGPAWKASTTASSSAR